jgi:2-polyprenyl-3-methyl-5-hydroxy-6-metoxy-1,4-benzoquinol methylase
MNKQTHWDNVYRTKTPNEMSWFRSHLETSLSLIDRGLNKRLAAVIDVGGGQSTLVSDLLALGYQDLTVLDISVTAIEHAKTLLGPDLEYVTWRVDDILQADLPFRRYDVWHDRAVFHFLTQPEQRLVYIQQATLAVKPGGRVVIGSFGKEGPNTCSGLDVIRYDADSLQKEFGRHFHLIESSTEMHQTPFETIQQFLYCSFIRI